MLWQPYPHHIEGVLVEGDPTRYRTIRPPYLNGLYVAFHWRQAVVIALPDKFSQYYVGFRDFRGTQMIRTKPLNTEFFGALIGREPCTFFVVLRLGDTEGVELEPETMRDHVDVIRKNPLITLI